MKSRGSIISYVVLASIFHGEKAAAAADIDRREVAAADAPNDGDKISPTIFVTARRRVEELQRTPVSVVVLSTKDLSDHSATNIRDIQRLVPNITVSPAQNVGDAAANIFIRGIGQEDFAAGTEPGVGLYVDGIYVGRTMGALFDLLDIARIEVLRGPQGTLYGRNTIGGAINVISMPPQAAASARLSASAGNLGVLGIKGAMNGPLNDQLSLRLAFSGTRQGGYLHRRLLAAGNANSETDHRPEGADERQSARIQLRLNPGGGWLLDATADTMRRSGTQSPTHLDAVDPSVLTSINQLVRQGILPGPEITGSLVSSDLRTSGAGGGNRIHQDASGVAFSSTKTFSQQQVRLIAAYRALHSDVSTDLDGTALNILTSEFDERSRQYSGELQASGKVSAFIYTAGLFALRESGELLPVAGGQDVLYLCKCFYSPATQPVTNFPARQVSSNSYALYVQASFPLLPKLSATLGTRYSIERKRIAGQLIRLDPDTLEPTDQVVARGTNHGRWNALTWRAGVEFQATPELMAYGSAARGFKSGGFNVRPSGRLPNLGLAAFAPETAVTYEAGLRSRWLDRRLKLNLTGFETDYRDIQLRRQTVLAGSVTTLVENAARAKVRGLEAEMSWRLLNELTLGINYGYIRPRFLDVGNALGLTLSSKFQRTPRHTLAAMLDYEAIQPWGKLGFHADFSFRSAEQFQIVASPWDQRSYGLIGARLVFSGHEDRWSLALFGTNLADTAYRTAGRASLLDQLGVAYSTVGRPREIGTELTVNF